MDGLVVRQSGPGDSEFAYRVKKAAFRRYVEAVWGWDEHTQRRLHEERSAAQDFRIISLAGTDVGVMATVVAGDCLKLNQLFLLPAYQSRGIGAACMEIVMAEARELNLPVRLRVLKVNPRAQAFYERVGFTPTGETDTHILMEHPPHPP